MEEPTHILDTREDYTEMVENQYFANVDGKNIEAVLNCFHPDALFTIQSAFSSHKGRDTNVKAMFENLFEKYSRIVHKDFRHVLDIDNECCASQFSVENVANDGSKIRLSNCNFFYFKNDKIQQIFVYMSGGINTLG